MRSKREQWNREKRKGREAGKSKETEKRVKEERERNNILLPSIFFNRGKVFGDEEETIGGVFFVCVYPIIGLY